MLAEICMLWGKEGVSRDYAPYHFKCPTCFIASEVIHSQIYALAF